MNEKYIRFTTKEVTPPLYGVLEDEKVTALASAPWMGIEKTDKSFDLKDIKLKAPVEPSKIVCIGLNYHAHVQASQSADKAPDYPLIFLKPPSSVIGPEEKIIHPQQSERVDYEAELGVVIGKTARKVPEEKAGDYIFGFTCVNDVTARDLQKKDGQWSRAKGFDTFCPVGPWLVRELNYRDVLVEGILNGDIKQSGRTSLMIFNIPFLISYISSVMTLNPGDLISTGTPAGIAPMKPGDKIEVKVEGVGNLVNHMA
ncbi:MAG: fumarylacetoacetate hydrolase family protein [candidate division Zixibacteria bacterium]|nr:fumarylacetoacetate hydrolase family protein [candidate division Zixibacteria bacterium]